MYRIAFAQSVAEDLDKVPAYYRTQVMDAMEKELAREPTTRTRNRKEVPDLRPPWEAVPPIWELRVGKYRVFYDVDEGEKTVVIRAVRHKPAGRTTEEIL